MKNFKEIVANSNFPKQSGVYQFFDNNNQLLYVGKAKNLNDRIWQYANGSINSYKTNSLISQTTKIEYIIVANEAEALVLEKNLISKLQPRYNIDLRDDRSYPYLKISKQNSGLAIEITYKLNKNHNSFYFGPFLKRSGAFEIKKLLESEVMYDKGQKANFADKQEIEKKFNICKEILQKSQWIEHYREKMEKASEQQQFELAQQYFESIKVLEQTFKQYQNIDLPKKIDLDFLYCNQENINTFVITFFFYRNGTFLSHRSFIIEIVLNFEESLINFLNFYYKKNFIPDKVILDSQMTSLKWSFIDSKINIEFTKNKSFLQILENVKQNHYDFIANNIELNNQKIQQIQSILFEIKQTFGVSKTDVIMSIDNSHFANNLVTTGIICFINGEHNKKYNRFFNYSGQKQGDIDYMIDGLSKYLRNKNFIKPNLLFVDGGLPQLKQVKIILEKHKIEAKVFGLVKNQSHKTSYIINENNQQIIVSQNVFNFLSLIQETVDEFAKLHYNKKKIKQVLNN